MSTTRSHRLPTAILGQEENLVLLCLNNFQCQHLEHQYSERQQERHWIARPKGDKIHLLVGLGLKSQR